MFPSFNIFGRTISSYAVAGAGGFILGMLFIVLASPHYKVNRENAIYIYTFSTLGALAGAKILYLVTVFPDMMGDLSLIRSNFHEFVLKYLQGGLVFYGGLIGFIIVAFIVAKQYHENLSDYYAVIVPGALLFAACGRVGCFLMGCCYGKRTSDRMIGVIFSKSPFAPNHVRLLPTQLFEVAADILILAIILLINRRPALRRFDLIIYLLLYSTYRFTAEYFRGDVIRGVVGGLSTSQWISIAIWIISAGGLTFQHHVSKKKV